MPIAGATEIKLHYICTDCRKAFKQSSPMDKMRRDKVAASWSRLDQKREGALIIDDEVQIMTPDDELEWQAFQNKYFSTPRCPQCNKPMTKVGPGFQPPRFRDKDAWRVLRKKMEIV